MQAIITKVSPATSFQTTRIIAKCSRGSLSLPTQALSENGHRSVVFALLQKFRTEDESKGDKNSVWFWPFVTGQLPSGDYVHVFVPDNLKNLNY